MSETKTMVQAMNELSAAFKELNRLVGAQVTPALLRLNEALAALAREMYLLRLRRWLPWVAFVFVLCVLIGWWLT